MTDAMLRARGNEEEWREKVIQVSLMCAADQFNVQAEDPGWNIDLHDDMLREASVEYAAAYNFRKELEKEEKRESAQKVRNKAVEGPS